MEPQPAELVKVLVVSSLYLREDRLTGQVVHQQCVELTKAGVSVEVICPIPRGVRGQGTKHALEHLARRARRLRLDGVPVAYVPYANIPHSVSPRLDARMLARALRRTDEARRDFELIHAHRLFPTAYAALALARQSGRPLLTTVHGSDIHTNPLVNARVGRLTAEVIRSGATVTTVSAALARDVRDFCHCSIDPVVTYLGVDTVRFRPAESRAAARARLDLPESGLCIATVCRLHRDKGVGHLISAFEQLRIAPEKGWMLIVGGGPARRELEDQVRGLGLGPQVVFTGPQPHAAIRDWLQAADIFALPSKKEGLPNSILEAMSSGLPVVATDVGGIGEAVTDACGHLVPYGDVAALAAALRSLMDSPELRSAQSRAARARAVDTFSWPASAERLIRVYEAVLRGCEAHA